MIGHQRVIVPFPRLDPTVGIYQQPIGKFEGTFGNRAVNPGEMPRYGY